MFDAFGISMLVAIIYIAALFAVVKLKKHKNSRGRFIFINLSILYFLLLVTITLLPVSGAEKMPPNFMPFVNIMAKTDTGYVFNTSIFFNYLSLSLLNVIMFLPLGFIMSTYFKERRLIICLVLGFLISGLIELLQLALPINRTFDIDDIIFNTLGSVLGYVIYLWISRFSINKKEVNK